MVDHWIVSCCSRSETNRVYYETNWLKVWFADHCYVVRRSLSVVNKRGACLPMACTRERHPMHTIWWNGVFVSHPRLFRHALCSRCITTWKRELVGFEDSLPGLTFFSKWHHQRHWMMMNDDCVHRNLCVQVMEISF